jgi:hypothetical protein
MVVNPRIDDRIFFNFQRDDYPHGSDQAGLTGPRYAAGYSATGLDQAAANEYFGSNFAMS